LVGRRHRLQPVVPVPEDGGGDKHCAVCGADDVPLERWHEEEEGGEEIYFCAQCRSYESLGKQLPRANAIRWQWVEAKDAPRDDFEAALRAFGAKINGSGGGGTMFAYAPEKPERVAENIEKAGGKAYIINVDSGAFVI